MKTYKKTMLATAIASLFLLSNYAASTPAEEEKVATKIVSLNLDLDSEKGAHIVVGEDSDTKVVELSKEALDDPAEIEAALADLPEDIREKVKNALAGIDLNSQAFAFKIDGKHDSHWLEGIDKKGVFVIDVDEEFITDSDEHRTIIKKVIKDIGENDTIFEFSHNGQLSTDVLLRMIKAGKFSQDDLDTLQKALDEKR